MGNKDEKTFADLFSSSTSEDKKIEQNFNDILKHDEGDNFVTNNDSSEGITFDSIFDSVKESSKPNEVDDKHDFSEFTEDKLSDNISSENISNDSVNLDKDGINNSGGINFNSIFSNVVDTKIENEVQDVEVIDNVSNNLFFGNEEEVVEKDDLNKEELKEELFFGNFSDSNNTEDNKVQDVEVKNNVSNSLFFDNEEEKVEEDNLNKEESKEDLFFGNVSNSDNTEDNKVQDDEVKANVSNNLFFGNEEEIVEKDNLNKEELKEDLFFGNVSNSDNTEDNKVQDDEVKANVSNNLFFGNEEVVVEKDDLNKKELKEDLFFGNVSNGDNTEDNKVQDDEVKANVSDNLFFGNEEEIYGKNELNNDELEEEPEEVSFFEKASSSNVEDNSNVNEDLNRNSSPFFEDSSTDNDEPINVFFQNKINLVENNVPSISNSNIKLDTAKHFNVKIVKKKEPLFKFIIGVFSYAIFIWLLLIGITLLVYVLDIKIRAAKGDYSAPTFNAYVVLTGSMLPDIQVSDVVITKKVDAKDLKKGDIITFASADSRFRGTIITHRIMKKNPSADGKGYTFQTKGDNNNVADSALVPENNIYGKVILKIPKLGYLQEFLASDGGWIIVILIPCLVVISYDTVKLAKGLKRKKYKNIKVQK